MRNSLTASYLARVPLLVAALAASGPAGTLAAQDGSGILVVRVRSKADSTPLSGAFVRSGRSAATTDRAGLAAIELPAGLAQVLVSRAGFRSWSFEITIVAEASQRVLADLDPIDPSPDSLAGQMIRGGAFAAGPALGAVFLSRRHVSQGGQVQASGLGRIVDDVIAAHPQLLSGPLGAMELRLLGLPGRYTGVLVDGLPIFGAPSGAYRLVQLSPFEFEQAEVHPGPMAAAYGPSGAGGALNLVSRRADGDTAQLAINQSSEKGGAAMAWASRRFNPTVGGSVFADFHQQRLVDADDDQWGEFPRAIRASVRPRLFLDRPNGDGVMLQAGVLSEDRTGGFLISNTEDDPYREELRTRRVDGALHAHRLTASGSRIDVRFAAALERRVHRFNDFRERSRRSTVFGEVTYSKELGRGTTVVAGTALQRDVLRNDDVTGFDFGYSVPSVFARVTLPFGEAATAAAAGRCDVHSEYGLRCNPRLTVLLRPTSNIRARLTSGTGYFAPTPATAAAEVLPLRQVIPEENDLETLRFGALDLEWSRGRFAVNLEAAYSTVSNPVILLPVDGDSAGRFSQVNASGPLRVFASSLGLTYRIDALVGRVYYLRQDGSESDAPSPLRRESGFTPRNTLGLTITWQGTPMGTWVHLNARHSGRQRIWDNPYRSQTRQYTVADVLVSQRMGRARLYVSGDNLFDVRLRDFEPLLVPAPGVGGRTTNTPWAPTRGRVVSLGAVVEW